MKPFADIQTINIEGETFGYRMSLPESGNTDKTLVLLHGWPEHSLAWNEMVQSKGPDMPLSLAEQFRIVAVDLRGLGYSNRSADWKKYRKNNLARDILNIMDSLSIQSFHLAAHDWGGAVAQELAFAEPDRVQSLTVSNILLIHCPEGWKQAKKVPAGPMDLNWYQSFLMTDLPEKMIPGNEEAFLRYILRTPKSNRDIPEYLIESYVETYSIPGSATAAANLYRSVPLDIRNWVKHKGVTCEGPVLLLWGSQDPVISTHFLEGSQRAFPNAVRKEVDAGHFVFEEKPVETAQIISEFISGL